MKIALTFDDGTVDQYRLAKLLYNLGIRCTIFVITNLRRHPATNKELLITEPEKLCELHRMGHEIGSHSCTHPDLRLISTDSLVKELSESKMKLEEIVNDEVLGFAYPYGRYNEDVLLQEVRKWYFYARGTNLFSEDPLNIKIHDRYRIGSIGMKKVVMLLPKIMKHRAYRDEITVVITLHDIPPILMFFLVIYLKACFRPQFVTMREIADKIYNCNNRYCETR
jgi:peptidoglycan/xylan/chitin deacetylase (PgdA/CDA1 family)